MSASLPLKAEVSGSNPKRAIQKGKCEALKLLEDVFSRAGAPSHRTGTQPRPAQPSCPPTGADSSGRGLRAPGCGQSDQAGFAPVIQLAVPFGLGPVLDCPSQPLFGETPLTRNTVPSDTSKAWAIPDADQPSVVLSRMHARVVTLVGLLPERTVCSSWSRSSGVSRTANSSLTHRHLTTSSSMIQNTIGNQVSEAIYQAKFGQPLVPFPARFVDTEKLPLTLDSCLRGND